MRGIYYLEYLIYRTESTQHTIELSELKLLKDLLDREKEKMKERELRKSIELL